MSNPLGSSGLEIYKTIILPIRQTDEINGGLLLKRLLDANAGPDTSQMGPQQIFERTETDIQSLLEQVDPAKVRSDLLQYLKDIVGFTAELKGITDRLDEEQLRRLINLAVPMWNERETELGMVNAIRLLTGRTANLTNWFGYRFILGEAYIGETLGIIGGSTSTYDEYWSNIRIMDDGTLDELLLLDVIRLERALGERIEVLLVDFLDKLDFDLNLWTQISGTPSIVDRTLLLPDGTEMQPIIPILPDDEDHVDYIISTHFTLGAGATFRTRWYLNADDDHYYQVEIKATSPRVVFKRAISGVETTLLSHDAVTVPVVEGVRYNLLIQTRNNGGDRFIIVHIDNTPVVPDNTLGEYTDTPGGGEPSAGPYRFIAENGDVTIDNIESWRFVPSARFATVELSTLTERGGEVTKTANFVQ